MEFEEKIVKARNEISSLMDKLKSSDDAKPAEPKSGDA
jgi:hypothetical protein